MSEPIGLRCMRRSALLLCAGSVLALAVTAASAQGNLSFLKDTPLAYFNAEDAKLMRAAALEVLQSSQDGTRKEWGNPATGNGGAITLVTQFSAPDGRPCSQVRVENRAKTMCKSPDGRWKVDAAKPPKK
jgi:hypothetical protein